MCRRPTLSASPGKARILTPGGINRRDRRRVDLKRVIEERFGVIYIERAISDLLVALSFSHISARPQHPKQDQRVIEAFKKTSPARSLPT